MQKNEQTNKQTQNVDIGWLWRLGKRRESKLEKNVQRERESEREKLKK